VATLRLTVLSKTIDELLRRCARMDGDIADLQAENVSLRRRVTELEHRCTSNQVAHNNLVAELEQARNRCPDENNAACTP
jgi:chromosome segregation ATPase